MLFSAYDTNAQRYLSSVLADAMETVRMSAGYPLNATEISDFTKRISTDLLLAYDAGTRDPEDLKRASLRGILYNRPKPPKPAEPIFTPATSSRGRQIGLDGAE